MASGLCTPPSWHPMGPRMPSMLPPHPTGISFLLHPRQPPPEVPGGRPPPSPPQEGRPPALTRVRLLGVLLALPADDEHEDEQEDEDEPHEGDDHQEPPLLVEGVGFLGWGTEQEGSEGGQAGGAKQYGGGDPEGFCGSWVRARELVRWGRQEEMAPPPGHPHSYLRPRGTACWGSRSRSHSQQ